MKNKDKPYLIIQSKRNNLANVMVISNFMISEKLADKEKFIHRLLKRGFPRMFGNKNKKKGINSLIDTFNRYNLGEKFDLKHEILCEKYGNIPTNGKLEIKYFEKNNFLEF